ncbi:MAG TPA: GtrA family protein, partial [Candidatus Sulfopaludibacter sp.]|nr:GtrA family protein [Candidatus Sulfopaludibacter sp.]
VMVRTVDARAAGGYNEERHGAICDCGNWTRVAVCYDNVACIQRPLARYTVHGGSVTLGSSIANWQRCGENIYEDLVATLRANGTRVPANLRSAGRNHISNITVTVLLQTVGRPGWVRAAVRECVRSRRYMLTPFVAKRMMRDGWKLSSLGNGPSRLAGRVAAQFPPGQFARYLLVGAWNTLFGYATYAAFTAALDPYIPQSYLAALVLSSIVNITNAFLAYKWFVFRTKGGYLREWARCLAVYGSSTALSLFLLPAVVAVLRYGAGMRQAAPYVGGALLTCFGVIYNFVGHRKFSFRTRLADRAVS